MIQKPLQLLHRKSRQFFDVLTFLENGNAIVSLRKQPAQVTEVCERKIRSGKWFVI